MPAVTVEGVRLLHTLREHKRCRSIVVTAVRATEVLQQGGADVRDAYRHVIVQLAESEAARHRRASFGFVQHFLDLTIGGDDTCFEDVYADECQVTKVLCLLAPLVRPEGRDTEFLREVDFFVTKSAAFGLPPTSPLV